MILVCGSCLSKSREKFVFDISSVTFEERDGGC